jgi:uncharacterized protein YgbK (DUF1537 family)
MIRFGCVADDYTGATDVASAVRRGGVRTTLTFGVPTTPPPDSDAAIVALKIRSAPAKQAARAAVDARMWLGDAPLFFKYCSTFDSTDAGNIGPVADALLEAVGSSFTIICPAAPQHGRTVFQGHLFVGDELLSESPMRHHPLNPMNDSNLVRLLARQTSGAVELVAHDVVRSGPTVLEKALNALAERGIRYAVVDAVSESDLTTIEAASRSLPLRTGAAGLAGAIAAALPDDDSGGRTTTLPTGPTVILAGSCSPATLSQIVHARTRIASHQLDPVNPSTAFEWLERNVGSEPVLAYSPEQRLIGYAAQVERIMGELARLAVHRGARRIVVAGGETSGAVIDSLGISQAVVGDELDPGVPWLLAGPDHTLALLLKSGNFGGPDFFLRAALEETCSSS